MTTRFFFQSCRLVFRAVLLLALSGSSGIASELRPSIVRITVNEATVRSAPDRDAYATSQLKQGDKVEIYLEVDGWCAIRPPGGSFSWVSAQYVNSGENSVGTVVVDGLASRIGSEMGEFGGTVQVKLRKGEKVLILDRVETPENPLSPSWFKIAPPSGEYRWVHRDSFKPQPEKPQIDRAQLAQTPRRLPKESSSIRQVVYENESAPAKPRPAAAARTESRNPEDIDRSLDEVRRAVTPPTAVSGDLRDFPPAVSRIRAAAPVGPVPGHASTDSFQKTYEELKTATLSILTRQADDEEFEILIERGKQLYGETTTDRDLEKVFHLVETLQRTRLVRQEIAMRRGFRTNPLLTPPQANPATANPYAANAHAMANRTHPWNSGAPIPRTNESVVPARNTGAVRVAEHTEAVPNHGVSQYKPLALHEAEDAPLIPEETVTFDMMGRLGAFDDIPEGYPPFALVDDNEEIICLLTPGKGLDLEPFVGEIVGVKGRREFYRVAGEADKRHVTVLEAFLLEER